MKKAKFRELYYGDTKVVEKPKSKVIKSENKKETKKEEE